MLNLVVSNPIDRIQRGGGSVVVSSVGAITAIVAAGRTGTLYYSNTASPMITWGTAGVGIPTTLTVTGTDPHTFSGPVKVSRALTNPLFVLADSGAAGAIRGVYQLSGASDTVHYAATGAAGSEVYTESHRVINSGAYLTVLNRLGVGLTAGTAPSYTLDIAGNSLLNGLVGINTNPAAGVQARVMANAGGTSAALLYQNATSATVPVLVVKGGATPTATGLLASLRNSADAEQFGIGATGQIRSNQFDATATVGAQLDRFPVYNASGTLVGYVPVYAAA